jgi:hypothetical protein
MPILEASELTELRTEFSDVATEVYPDLCNVLRMVTRVRDVNNPESYEPDQTGLAIYTFVPCKYGQPTGQEFYGSQRVENVGSYRVTLPAFFDIKVDDQLEIIAKGTEPSFLLNVIGVLTKSNGVKRILLCERAV